MKNKLGFLAVALISIFLPALSNAASYYCDGIVNSVAMNNADGAVWVSYGPYSIQQVCRVDATTNSVNPDTCKAWVALFMSAQAQGRTMRFYYDSTVGSNPSSCAGLAGWQSYSPNFVQIL